LPFSIDGDSLLYHYKIISADNTQGRKIGTIGSMRAQQYIRGNLNDMAVTPFKGSYQHAFTFNRSFQKTPVVGQNLIGVIKGVEYENSYIVLSAHFDHLGEKGGHIYNGADDNASGTAALLSIAYELVKTPLKHSVIILFTDGEESDLKGAKAFIHQNPDLLPHIKLNINMDMLAGSKSSNYLHYISNGLDKIISEQSVDSYKQNYVYSDFKIIKGFGKRSGSIQRQVNWNQASDHGVFYNKRIPFIYYGVGTHKNYHTKNDTYQNSNHALLVKSTNAIYQQLRFIDKMID